MTWKHPKYYKELERIRKQREQADKRASERAVQETVPHNDIEEANRRAGGPEDRKRTSSDQASGERASKRSSVRAGFKQQALNVFPIIHCEGRCFAVVYEQTGKRGAFK